MVLDRFTQKCSFVNLSLKKSAELPFQETLKNVYCGSTANGVCICMWLERRRNHSIRASFRGLEISPPFYIMY